MLSPTSTTLTQAKQRGDQPRAGSKPSPILRGERPDWIQAGPAKEDTLHHRFEQQAKSRPAAIAISFEGEDWTFERLDQHADQIAAHLISGGVLPGDLVGVYMERSPWLIAALLGVQKCGAAYVPLDPAFPSDRLAMICEDAAVSKVLASPELDGTLAVADIEFVWVSESSPFIGDAPVVYERPEVLSDSLAYVIFTSGSTGRPKGVAIEHRPAVNLVLSLADQPGFDSEDTILAMTTISFDMSVPEIFMSLLTGGRMVLAPRGLGADGARCAELITDGGITVAQGTPTTWRLVLASGWTGAPRLKIIAGGEPVDADLADKLRPYCDELWNFYGPTETTVWSTCCRIEPRDGGTPSIGKPLPHNDILILDEQLKAVAEGQIGEICIGGSALARGYHGRDVLTAEKFVPNPFANAGEYQTAHLYRTGDLGRVAPDGMLECLGRADNQVKVRGYRIELGEIESALKAHPAVRDAVVVVVEPSPGDQRIVGHIIAGGSAPPSRTELQDHAAGTLPSYMVPSAFQFSDDFPKTPNLKIDRRALAELTDVVKATREGGATPVELTTDAASIAAVWADVLGLEQIGAGEDLFRLGAHSMHLAQVATRLKEAGIADMSVAEMFQHRTAAAIARAIGQQATTPGRRLRQPQSARRTGDIAIIGISARFPGARDLETYWDNICAGVESVRDFSEEELREAGVPEHILADRHYVRRGCSLDQHDHFDAAVFDMSPREAELTNPQHRVFLQAAWEALEHAGYSPKNPGPKVGLYAGAGHNSYTHATADQSSQEYLQTLVGNEQDYLTTRTAFKLGLDGPALNIQNACATSLVAVHTACDALHSGACEMALAGGVSIAWPEGQGYVFGEGLIFSPDGHCRPFDADAAGTVFGHGVGVVSLKLLEDAVRDGDTVHAVIKGTATNNDGARKGSFAAPSIDGQAEMIGEAIDRAGIDPASIGFMEAHGTGTSVGDPIEIAGLTKAWRRDTDAKTFCALGSVKANIGHVDAAAGVAGLIKAALAVKHGVRPPAINFSEPNPALKLEESPFYIPTQRETWNSEAPRTAAVSSIGLGGTNAHAVLAEHRGARTEATAGQPRAFQLLPFSAKTPGAFAGHAPRWSSFLDRDPDVDLAAAAATLQLGRHHFGAHRGFVVAGSSSEALETFQSGGPKEEPSTTLARDPVFLFSGQGTQYPAMARGVYESEPVFRHEFERCSDLLEPLISVSLAAALYGEKDIDLTRTEFAQPALFAVAYSQAQLWMSWGVRPAALLGHSIGEYVAATLAGVFTLRDALTVVAARGRLMGACEPGDMLAVMSPASEVEPLLADRPQLDLAASNGPTACVVAGPAGAVEDFANELKANHIRHQTLKTSHAFHSAMMEPALEDFAAVLDKVSLREPTLPYLSNVTGGWITAEQATDPDYYVRHIRGAVRFAECVAQLLEDRPERLLLEMGPGQTLTSLAKQQFAAHTTALAVPTLPSAKDDTHAAKSLMQALGQAWSSGAEIDWDAFNEGRPRHRVPLPTYPFDEKRYRIATDKTAPTPDKSAKRPDVAEWLYAPGWRSLPPIDTPPADEASQWLLLGRSPKPFTKRLRELGAQVTSLKAASPRALERWAKTLAEGETAHLALLVPHGRRFDASPAAARRGRETTLDAVLDLTSLWNDVGGGRALELHLITHGANAVAGDEIPQPQHSAAATAAIVVTQEFPGIRCRHLDLPRSPQRTDLGLAAEVCLAAAGEAGGAVRAGKCWARDFGPLALPAPAKASPAYRDGGHYMITGGLGRVGMLFAAHLAEHSRAKLTLLSRRGVEPGSDLSRQLEELEQNGASVLALAADASSPRDLRAALEKAEAKHGPLHGVIHAAGTIDSTPVADTTPAGLDRCLSAKIDGTLALHRALAGRDLDFVLLTSSMSAVLGGLGYYGYAAGNAFLDAFAAWANARQSSAAPWVSVAWDAWRFADDDPTTGPGAAMYRIAMSGAESCHVLDRAIASSAAASGGVVVSTASLEPRLEQWVNLPAATAPTAAQLSDQNDASTSATGPDKADALDRMIGIWADSLRRPDIAPDDNYFELGGDSLLAVGLFATIEREFGVAVPLSTLFKSPTPAELTAIVAPDHAEPTSSRHDLPPNVIAIQADGDKRPLFAIHGADGGVMFYRELGLHLDGRPFYAVESPLLADPELEALPSVKEVAAAYLRDIKTVQPDGPYLLAGYSFGGAVAFEIAQQLTAAGEEVEQLLIYDTLNPASTIQTLGIAGRLKARWSRERGNALQRLFGIGRRVATGAAWRLKFELENRRAKSAKPANTTGPHSAANDDIDAENLRHVQARQQHDALFDAYVPQPYSGDVLLVLAEAGGGDKWVFEENLGWNRVVLGELRSVTVPGAHLHLFKAPALPEVIAATRETLLDSE